MLHLALKIPELYPAMIKCGDIYAVALLEGDKIFILFSGLNITYLPHSLYKTQSSGKWSDI